MDIVGTIKTGSETFDAAIEHLRQYHLCHHWDDGSIRIYLNQRPVGLLSRDLWGKYVDALLTVVNVGLPYVTQVQERGLVGYLSLPAHLEQAGQPEERM